MDTIFKSKSIQYGTQNDVKISMYHVIAMRYLKDVYVKFLYSIIAQ